MSWLGLGLGEFGSQLGQASELNEQRRLRMQQMAAEAARVKVEESLLPLRMMEMQEIQARMQKAALPQAVWHELPGKGIGYTMEEPGKPPGELHVVTPGAAEYTDYHIDDKGRMTAFNKTSGKVELLPTQEGIRFPLPAGARPNWMKTYDERGDLRYATHEPNGTVSAWGKRVPETLAQESFIDPATGNQYQIRVPLHQKKPGPVMMTPEARASWRNILAGREPNEGPGVIAPGGMPVAPEEAMRFQQPGPPPPEPEKAPQKAPQPRKEPYAIQGPRLPALPAPQAGAASSVIYQNAPSAGGRPVVPFGAYPDEPRLVKTGKPEAQALQIVRTIEQSAPILDRLIPIMQQGKWADRGDPWSQAQDAVKMRARSALYNHGIAPGEPWNTVIQLTSLLKIVQAIPYMRGMRNQYYLQQIQEHLPNPMQDTPYFMYRKIMELIPILAETRRQNLVPVQPGRPAPFPFQTPGQQGGDVFNPPILPPLPPQ